MKMTLICLLTGALAGWLFEVAGLPLPWLIGPLLVTSGLSLAGQGARPPGHMRKLGQMVAALSVGTTFTPEVVAGLGGWAPLILFCALASIGAGVLTAAVLARLTRMSFDTSYFAAMPGGVAEMSVLAERYGGDTAVVAVAQSLRIIVVVLTIPFALYALGGSTSGGAVTPSLLSLQPALLAGMAVAAVALGLLLDRLGVMNAWFLAGLALGIFAVLGPVPLSAVPHWAVCVAQVLIGVALGARVDPARLRALRAFLPLTLGGTVLLIVFNAAMSWAIHKLWGLPIETMVLATSPGGVAEMSITARALHLAAPLVTAFHLVRILLIVALSAPVYRACRRWA